MQTLAEQRAQLTATINGGMHTLGTTRTALDNHSDQLVTITHDLSPVLGSLAMNAHNFPPAFRKVKQLSEKFFKEVWMPDRDTSQPAGESGVHPVYSYTRADCPRYGEFKGPSCYTAPLVAVRPHLPENLLPQNYQPPKNMAPPPGTVLGPNGNLVAVGPPLINPNPNLVDPNPPLPADMTPAPPVPGSANPANVRPAVPPTPVLSPPAPVARPGYPDFPWPGPGQGVAPAPPAPAPPAGPLPAEAAPAAFGGNVGPVGSDQERMALSVMTGSPASSATQLLLGPVARGTTVSLAPHCRGIPMKSFRGPLIGLSLFMVVAMGLTWLVYATLRRDVIGATTPYSAVFTDVFGLRDGDDVRVAGVRVGRVQKVELQDSKLAKVDFIVQSDQTLFDKTVASVTYENIVGQRYLGLSLGNIGGSHKLPAGATIPVERTDPSFDVGIVVNGFEPLFTLVNPEDLNNLTLGAVKSLQGDECRSPGWSRAPPT